MLLGVTGSGKAFTMANVLLQAQRPAIDRLFAFAELPRAMDHLASDQHFGKICIRH